MRILLITDVSLYMRGGVPAEVRALCAGLVARGHAVGLVSDTPLKNCPQAAHFPLSLPIDGRFTAEIDQALSEFKPDFVHVLSMSSGGVTRLAPRLRAYRWALTVHSVPPHERKLAGFHTSEQLHYGVRAMRLILNTLAWRWVFSRGMAPLIVVHSQFVQDIVVRYGCGRDRLRLIALPFVSEASTRATRAVSDSPLLVTVGGYAHTKGQHDLIKALPALVRTFPRLHCQLIGEVRDGSYVEYLRDLASSLGVSDRVRLTPDLSHADKQAALESADVYVQPSHEEGFCLAYAEAAAVVPRLVGTDTGAIAAISRGDAGARVVNSRDPAGIATAVRELLESPLPADHMPKRAAQLSMRFSEREYLNMHEELYGASR